MTKSEVVNSFFQKVPGNDKADFFIVRALYIQKY